MYERESLVMVAIDETFERKSEEETDYPTDFLFQIFCIENLCFVIFIKFQWMSLHGVNEK